MDLFSFIGRQKAQEVTGGITPGPNNINGIRNFLRRHTAKSNKNLKNSMNKAKRTELEKIVKAGYGTYGKETVNAAINILKRVNTPLNVRNRRNTRMNMNKGIALGPRSQSVPNYRPPLRPGLPPRTPLRGPPLPRRVPLPPVESHSISENSEERPPIQETIEWFREYSSGNIKKHLEKMGYPEEEIGLALA
jgi:hypothetical protein